ncbi:MAG TPA: CocE/NonD family hydrolase, partial [Isosphaeraceae bacterium]|nr:CocE/NonD family hydrolase [Isosphaeraceae bacterium]
MKACGTLLVFLGLLSPSLAADNPAPLADYFQAQADEIAKQPLQGIKSAEEWKAKRPEMQRRMLEMLGLWPLPEKTPLNARVTGTLEKPDFLVEKLLFESRPGLFVTANLYRPKGQHGPLPAILYVCGHAKVEKDGVIFGNKTHYQHHAEWYAANGYVCLVVDTLQLGELPGLHHGTFQEGMWWWMTRGYTPAGVEAWNGVRAIDYLISRDEVDPKKIGVTGRSGGGATSWWLGAIDDRLAAVAPVAGITDMVPYVAGGDFAGPHKNGTVEGHCDCMFVVNTYQWDYTMIAALCAPKPLLVENTDEDPIFPEEGVRRVYDALETVYGWYDAKDKLGLVIGKGGHMDTEELRHPSFAFMEKWLKGKDVEASDIEEPDRKIPNEDLKVLARGETPQGNRNDTIHETFVPRRTPEVETGSLSKEGWEQKRREWTRNLHEKVFAGWPRESDAGSLNPEVTFDKTREGIRLREVAFTSQEGVRLTLYLFSAEGESPAKESTLVVLNEKNW